MLRETINKRREAFSKSFSIGRPSLFAKASLTLDMFISMQQAITIDKPDLIWNPFFAISSVMQTTFNDAIYALPFLNDKPQQNQLCAK